MITLPTLSYPFNSTEISFILKSLALNVISLLISVTKLLSVFSTVHPLTTCLSKSIVSSYLTPLIV